MKNESYFIYHFLTWFKILSLFIHFDGLFAGVLYSPQCSPKGSAQLKVCWEHAGGHEEGEVGLLKVGNVVEDLHPLGATLLLSQHGRLVHAVNVHQVAQVPGPKACSENTKCCSQKKKQTEEKAKVVGVLSRKDTTIRLKSSIRKRISN